MAFWIVFEHYLIITQSNSTIILFLHCINETIMLTHSTSDIAHINMPPPKMMSCDYIKPPRSALTSPMVALPTLTFPPMLREFLLPRITQL